MYSREDEYVAVHTTDLHHILHALLTLFALTLNASYWDGSYMAETGLDRGRANSASLHLAHVQVTDCSTATDTHAAGAQDGSQSALTAAEWAQTDQTQHPTHQD